MTIHSRVHKTIRKVPSPAASSLLPTARLTHVRTATQRTCNKTTRVNSTHVHPAHVRLAPPIRVRQNRDRPAVRPHSTRRNAITTRRAGNPVRRIVRTPRARQHRHKAGQRAVASRTAAQLQHRAKAHPRTAATIARAGAVAIRTPAKAAVARVLPKTAAPAEAANELPQGSTPAKGGGSPPANGATISTSSRRFYFADQCQNPRRRTKHISANSKINSVEPKPS